MDHRRFGPAEEMGASQARTQTDTSEPDRQQPDLLPDALALIPYPLAFEEKVAGILLCRLDAIVHGFPGPLGNFEPDGPTGLLLAYDGAIESREFAEASFTLKLCSNCPNVPGPKGP